MNFDDAPLQFNNAPRLPRLWASCALALFALGCTKREDTASAAPSAAPPQSAAPLSAETENTDRESTEASAGSPVLPRRIDILTLEGLLPAPMRVPTQRPPKGGFRVVFAAHGAGGRAEHHCEFWDELLPPDMWILCPAGALLRRGQAEGGQYYPDHLKLRAELQALVQGMSEAFGGKLRSDAWMYIGYSQGATMGALAIVPSKTNEEGVPIFSDLVLIEGGGEYWTLQRARGFQQRGGQAVLLACGTNGCAAHGKRSLQALSHAELTSSLAYAKDGGHTYGGEVGRALYDDLLPFLAKEQPPH